MGLDVGSYSVKLIAVHGPGGGVRAAEAPLRAEPVADADPSAESVAEAIQDALHQLGLTPRTVRGITMGISGADVIVKQVTLPLIDESEVAGALKFEARKHLPFDPQSMVIDWQILGRYVSERRTDVLLAAVAKEHLDRHVAPLALLDLAADIVDATPLALTNAVVDAGEPGDPALLLDVGHAASHLTLYQRGEPFFTRRLDFGGRTLTQAIAADLAVPFDEAEEWKLAVGADRPGVRVDWSGRELQAVEGALQRTLVDELRRSLAFYRTLGPLPDPLLLHLSGGSARLPGIATRLGDMLGIGVTVFDPLESGNGGGRRAPAPQFTQARGLALRVA